MRFIYASSRLIDDRDLVVGLRLRMTVPEIIVYSAERNKEGEGYNGEEGEEAEHL